MVASSGKANCAVSITFRYLDKAKLDVLYFVGCQKPNFAISLEAKGCVQVC